MLSYSRINTDIFIINSEDTMSYKRILVAVDLSESSEKVINKAVALAKDADAKLSFIFVDVDHISNISATNIEISMLPPIEEREKGFQRELQALADKSDYPIDEAIVVMGNLSRELKATITKNNIDLLICGHHHDFWSRTFSSVNKLLNAVETDLLIVYLK